jgi:hypothetical protein
MFGISLFYYYITTASLLCQYLLKNLFKNYFSRKYRYIKAFRDSLFLPEKNFFGDFFIFFSGLRIGIQGIGRRAGRASGGRKGTGTQNYYGRRRPEKHTEKPQKNSHRRKATKETEGPEMQPGEKADKPKQGNAQRKQRESHGRSQKATKPMRQLSTFLLLLVYNSISYQIVNRYAVMCIQSVSCYAMQGLSTVIVQEVDIWVMVLSTDEWRIVDNA